MSFFEGTSAKEPDLSGKSSQELDSIRTELNEKKKNIVQERIKVNKSLRLYDSQLKDIERDLKIIDREVKRRQDIEEAKNIICSDIWSIVGFELLSEDELSIITTNMDRTDYRKHGVGIRFYDLDRICREVINIKQKYPKWTLTSLARGGQYDTLPPHTFYRYEYKDEDGCYFNLGGIK